MRMNIEQKESGTGEVNGKQILDRKWLTAFYQRTGKIYYKGIKIDKIKHKHKKALACQDFFCVQRKQPS